MSQTISIELTNEAHRQLETAARRTHRPLEAVAAELIEAGLRKSRLSPGKPAAISPDERAAAIQAFERHLGSVWLEDAKNADNQAIDDDIVQAIADNHEAS